MMALELIQELQKIVDDHGDTIVMMDFYHNSKMVCTEVKYVAGEEPNKDFARPYIYLS